MSVEPTGDASGSGTTTAPARAPRRPSRHEGKRLSVWRVLLALAVVTAVITGGAFGVPYLLRQAQVTPAALTGWFAPYVDVTTTRQQDFVTETGAPESEVVLAFVVAQAKDQCVPTWGAAYTLDAAASALDLDRRLAKLRSQGGDAMVSFGGQKNTELASACADEASLQKAYAAVIDRYEVGSIDLDIEGAALTDAPAATRRAQAGAALQKERAAKGQPLEVWVTLPVGRQGLTSDGQAAVRTLLAAGVTLSGVNAMTMDYNVDLGGATMGQVAIDALSATHDQVEALWSAAKITLPEGGAWALIGSTPMIGQNDVTSEVFTIADAQKLSEFAVSKAIGRMSMWSLNRDRTCGPNYPDPKVVSTDCSGVDQGGQSFATVLSAGLTQRPSASPAASSVPTPVTSDDPSTAPYPIWSPDQSYSVGVKVVWHGNVYVAKYWTQGNPQPDDPTLAATESAWTLVGPVLATDTPYALPSVAPGTYAAWSASVAYHAGDKVQVGSTPYVAKWWTQGDDPSLSQTDHERSPWQVLGQ